VNEEKGTLCSLFYSILDSYLIHLLHRSLAVAEAEGETDVEVE